MTNRWRRCSPVIRLFRHDEIKRILVVKVDHIGDFITAIPAIRRLKQIFPAASIHVLASRARTRLCRDAGLRR